MKKIKAYSLQQAHELLTKKQAKNVELCFELSSDEFFNFADEWCEKGAKVMKEENFIIRLKSSLPVPPVD